MRDQAGYRPVTRVHQNVTDGNPILTDDQTPTSAARLRAMAEEAEAEAAAADALAVAARARIRAIQLRRQAEATGQPKDVPADHDTAGRPRPSTVAASFAVLVSLLALAGGGYMVWQHRDASQQRARAAEFAAAARKDVVELTSLDFENPRQGVQRILDVSTGMFKDDFTKNADDFMKVVQQSKVIERGTVNATAVDLDSMTKDSAVVLVASTAEVTNAAGAKQEQRKFKLIVTLTRDGGQIKMSKVEFVP